jgi:hypothetical protein
MPRRRPPPTARHRAEEAALECPPIRLAEAHLSGELCDRRRGPLAGDAVDRTDGVAEVLQSLLLPLRRGAVVACPRVGWALSRDDAMPRIEHGIDPTVVGIPIPVIGRGMKMAAAACRPGAGVASPRVPGARAVESAVVGQAVLSMS